MERFDGRQIRYAGTELRRLISMTADKARRTSQVRSNGEAQGEATALANIAQPVAAVAPIGSALLRVDPSSSTFTSSHLVFARLCLETRAYHDALPVIDLNIYHFPPTTNKAAENSMFPYLCSNHESSCTYLTLDSGLSGKLDYRDHLRYYLFSAMIYMAMKKWKHALLFLEIVMMTPVANNASKMQVEAYKKWVLVSLLHKGHVSVVTGLCSLPLDLFLTSPF